MIFDLSNISSNGRDQFGRLEAEDLDQACDMVTDYFFDPKFKDDLNIDWMDKDQVTIGSFEDAPGDLSEDDLEYFEAEYSGIEITKSDDQESRDFKTIFGENNFYYLKDGKIIKDLDQYTMIQNLQKLGAALK